MNYRIRDFTLLSLLTKRAENANGYANYYYRLQIICSLLIEGLVQSQFKLSERGAEKSLMVSAVDFIIK